VERERCLEGKRHGMGIKGWFAMSAILAIGAASCGDPIPIQETPPIEFQISDSAQIRLAETSQGALETDLPWHIDSIPNLELGGSASSGPELFFRLGGARGLPDGSIVVLDGGSQELRWFDESGSHLRSFGGPGEGPDEFLAARLLARFQNDSLLLYDQRLRRFTEIAADFSDRRIWELGSIDAPVLMGAAHGAKGERVLFTVGSGECIEAEYCESSTYVRWVNPRTGAADTLATFVRKRHRIRNNDGLPYAMTGPFDPVVAIAVGPAGPVVTGGPEHELKLFDEVGNLVSIMRITAPPRSPTKEELEYLVNERVGIGLDARAVDDAVARMGVPESTPAFQDVIVDRLGWYWVEMYRVDPEASARWLVFDPEGRAHGMSQLPRGLKVYDIGEDYVLGRGVSELGVEYIRRHELKRIIQ